MAPPKRSGFKSKSTKNRKSKKIQRKGPSITTEKPSIGRLVAFGVRSLLGMLPGAPFTTKLSDFIFKSFGIAENISVATNGLVNADPVLTVSTAASFIVTSGNILASSKLCSMNGDNKTCRYSSSRVLSFTVMVSPDNIQSRQSGEILLGLSPFWDISEPHGDVNYPNANGINSMFMSIRGPANKPLSLTFRPKPSDGRAYQFSNHDERFAWIQMIYLKENRTSYIDFNADEVSFQVAISGKVEIRSGDGSMSGSVITDTVEDLLNKTGMAIQDSTTKKIYHLQAAKFSQQPTNSAYGGYKVSGFLLPEPTHLSLASMEM